MMDGNMLSFYGDASWAETEKVSFWETANTKNKKENRSVNMMDARMQNVQQEIC